MTLPCPSRAALTVAPLAVLLAVTPSLRGQPATPPAPAPATVKFSFERPGLPVPKFTLSVSEDGTGFYLAEEAPARSGHEPEPASAAPPTQVSSSLSISPATTEKIFAAARELNHFQVTCASKLKNIADTGAKTLSYTGPDGPGACSYNYSELKPVIALTATFQAIAFTLDAGRRLAFRHRYDRLGLDEELALLVKARAEGSAIEFQTIRPTLQAIAADENLMERARQNAVKLMDESPPAKPSEWAR